ncbi:TetR/AcrR family transcriptional regulator [Oceanirhabdus sp. W0125-5]|uniref:TetR/AcrR family transcriptional regulator n=1 Tax=Oceanirhabdus sp. W0125-5 TaxID=2999116 RepID=UPI0022F2E94D|nr:TetR/AcrR family transcriptional regulator [Oceanirhabdus sp. W0125-5]WBW95659.1 TetR/AcrR family transcriptional regulator [Oceanirhabdus sp. W0125-5]
MQIQKEEIRNAILKVAEDEFYTHGFEKASIRKIVKLAGTTIGNFYNYFDNKEALFEAVVKDEYNNFIYFLNHHDEEERPNYLWDLSDTTMWKKVLSQFVKALLPSLTRKFVILIEGSIGTKYSSTKQLIIDLLKCHFNEHVNEYNPSYELPNMGEILAEQLINGIILILRKYINDDEKKNSMLVEYILFYFIGSMGIIRKP